MATTALSVQFEVNDVDADYEVIGAGANYSFKRTVNGHKLVQAYEVSPPSSDSNYWEEAGSSTDAWSSGANYVKDDVCLYDQKSWTALRSSGPNQVGRPISDGDLASVDFDLEGNYGVFTVRVFAKSDLGIRSEFLEKEINIPAPQFGGSFSFAELRISNAPEGGDSLILQTPSPQKNEYIAENEFVNKNPIISWALSPPVGHPLEGKVAREELLVDPFFSRFEVTFRKVIVEPEVSESWESYWTEGPNASFSTNVSGATVWVEGTYPANTFVDHDGVVYRSISETQASPLDEGSWQAVSPWSRTQQYLETDVIEHKGKVYTAIKSSGETFYYGDQNYISLEALLGQPEDVDAALRSYRHFSFEFDAELYQRMFMDDATLKAEGREFNVEITAYDSNGGSCLGILRGTNPLPTMQGFIWNLQKGVFECNGLSSDLDWQGMNLYRFSTEDEIDSADFLAAQKASGATLEKYFFTKEQLESEGEQPKLSQTFNRNYYYAISAVDGCGEGEIFNLSAQGLSKTEKLIDIRYSVEIGYPLYREVKDDLIFEWKLIDNFGDVVDIEDFLYDQSDDSLSLDQKSLATYNGLLGFSGALVDSDDLSIKGYIGAGEGNDNNKTNYTLNTSYRYDRDFNNALYGDSIIRESGKRDIDLDLSLVDVDGETVHNVKIYGRNPAPKINFLNVDSHRSVGHIDLNFAYFEGSKEKTTKVELYRNKSTGNFDIEAYSALTVQSDVPDFNGGYDYDGTQYKQKEVSATQKDHIIYKTAEGLWRLKKDDADIAEARYLKSKWSYIAGGIVIDNFKVSFLKEILPAGDDGIYKTANSYVVRFVNQHKAATALSSLEIRDQVIIDGEKYFVSNIGGHGGPYTFSINEYSTAFGTSTAGVALYTDSKKEYLVQTIFGEGQNTRGNNITSITDDPPFDYHAENGDELITSYYYKVLPYDDYGSGHLWSIPEESYVYPFKYHDSNDGFPGAVDSGPPLPISGLTTDSSFETFSLEWEPSISPDVSHYEVWSFTGSSLEHFAGGVATHPYVNSFDTWKENAIYNAGSLTSGAFVLEDNKQVWSDDLEPTSTHWKFYESVKDHVSLPNFELDKWSEIGSTDDLLDYNPIYTGHAGYGVLDEVIDKGADDEDIRSLTKEMTDPAEKFLNTEGLEIAYRTDANQTFIRDKGKTNQTKYFWVRAVDKAGNKSLFYPEPRFGKGVHIGQAKVTDLEDFEQEITQQFENTIALIPNNPFSYDSDFPNNLSWSQHYLYNKGVGYLVEAGEVQLSSLSNLEGNLQYISEQTYPGLITDASTKLKAQEELFIYWTPRDAEELVFNQIRTITFGTPAVDDVISVQVGAIQTDVNVDAGNSATINQAVFDALEVSLADYEGVTITKPGDHSVAITTDHAVTVEAGLAETLTSTTVVFDDTQGFNDDKRYHSEQNTDQSGSSTTANTETSINTDDVGNPLKTVQKQVKYRFAHANPSNLKITSFVEKASESTKYKLVNFDLQGVTSDQSLLREGDFVVAQFTANIGVKLAFHAFANAVIGSASIADAAITSAKIKDLTADRIRAGVIGAEDMQVYGGVSPNIQGAPIEELIQYTPGNNVWGMMRSSIDGSRGFDDYPFAIKSLDGARAIEYKKDQVVQYRIHSSEPRVYYRANKDIGATIEKSIGIVSGYVPDEIPLLGRLKDQNDATDDLKEFYKRNGFINSTASSTGMTPYIVPGVTAGWESFWEAAGDGGDAWTNSQTYSVGEEVTHESVNYRSLTGDDKGIEIQIISEAEGDVFSDSTCSTTSGSKTVAIGSTTELVVGLAVAGVGIPNGTTIDSIGGTGNTFALTKKATVTQGSATLVFSPIGVDKIYINSETTDVDEVYRGTVNVSFVGNSSSSHNSIGSPGGFSSNRNITVRLIQAAAKTPQNDPNIWTRLDDVTGFYLKGDGSVSIQAAEGLLKFEDGRLIVEGDIRQPQGGSFGLVNLTLSSNVISFDAFNQLDTRVPLVPIDVTATFQNPSGTVRHHGITWSLLLTGENSKIEKVYRLDFGSPGERGAVVKVDTVGGLTNDYKKLAAEGDPSENLILEVDANGSTDDNNFALAQFNSALDGTKVTATDYFDSTKNGGYPEGSVVIDSSPYGPQAFEAQENIEIGVPTTDSRWATLLNSNFSVSVTEPKNKCFAKLNTACLHELEGGNPATSATLTIDPQGMSPASSTIYKDRDSFGQSIFFINPLDGTAIKNKDEEKKLEFQVQWQYETNLPKDLRYANGSWALEAYQESLIEAKDKVLFYQFICNKENGDQVVKYISIRDLMLNPAAIEPGVTEGWDLFWEAAGDGGAAWSSVSNYVAGNKVTHGSVNYKSREHNRKTELPTYNEAEDWDSKINPAYEWSDSAAYSTTDLVIYEGNIYRADADISIWNAEADYAIDSYVQHNGTGYRAKVGVSAIEPDVTDGWEGSWELFVLEPSVAPLDTHLSKWINENTTVGSKEGADQISLDNGANNPSLATAYGLTASLLGSSGARSVWSRLQQIRTDIIDGSSASETAWNPNLPFAENLAAQRLARWSIDDNKYKNNRYNIKIGGNAIENQLTLLVADIDLDASNYITYGADKSATIATGELAPVPALEDFLDSITIADLLDGGSAGFVEVDKPLSIIRGKGKAELTADGSKRVLTAMFSRNGASAITDYAQCEIWAEADEGDDAITIKAKLLEDLNNETFRNRPHEDSGQVSNLNNNSPNYLGKTSNHIHTAILTFSDPNAKLSSRKELKFEQEGGNVYSGQWLKSNTSKSTLFEDTWSSWSEVIGNLGAPIGGINKNGVSVEFHFTDPDNQTTVFAQETIYVAEGGDTERAIVLTSDTQTIAQDKNGKLAPSELVKVTAKIKNMALSAHAAGVDPTATWVSPVPLYDNVQPGVTAEWEWDSTSLDGYWVVGGNQGGPWEGSVIYEENDQVVNGAISDSCSLVNGSFDITVNSGTSNLEIGMLVSGTGITEGSRITAIDPDEVTFTINLSAGVDGLTTLVFKTNYTAKKSSLKPLSEIGLDSNIIGVDSNGPIGFIIPSEVGLNVLQTSGITYETQTEHVYIKTTDVRDNNKTATVQLLSRSGGQNRNPYGEEFSDDFTFYLLDEGSDSIAAILSNETASFDSLVVYQDESGNKLEKRNVTTLSSFTGASDTKILLFEGSQKLVALNDNANPHSNWLAQDVADTGGARGRDLDGNDFAALKGTLSDLEDYSSTKLKRGQYIITDVSSTGLKGSGDKGEVFNEIGDSFYIQSGGGGGVDDYDSFYKHVINDKTIADHVGEATVTYTIKYKTFSGKTGNVTKTQTFSKSSGADDSRVVKLSTGTHVVKSSESGEITPDQITITALASNFSHDLIGSTSTDNDPDQLTSVWQVRERSEEGVILSEDYFTHSFSGKESSLILNNTAFNNTDKIFVKVTIEGEDGKDYSDSLAILKLSDGSGSSSVVLSNPNVSLPTDEDNLVVDFSGSGTEIQVYGGSSLLSPVPYGAVGWVSGSYSTGDVVKYPNNAAKKFYSIGDEITATKGGAFDGDLTTDDAANQWRASINGNDPADPNTDLPVKIGQDFGMQDTSNETIVTEYIIHKGTVDATFMPKSWKFEGSNNWFAWTELDEENNQSWDNSSQKRFSIDSPAAYRYYRLRVTENNSGNEIRIQELELLLKDREEDFYKANDNITAERPTDTSGKWDLLRSAWSLGAPVMSGGNVNLSGPPESSENKITIPDFAQDSVISLEVPGPVNSLAWNALPQPNDLSGYDEWDGETFYFQGKEVKKGGTVYRALKTSGPTHRSNWNKQEIVYPINIVSADGLHTTVNQTQTLTKPKQGSNARILRLITTSNLVKRNQIADLYPLEIEITADLSNIDSPTVAGIIKSEADYDPSDLSKYGILWTVEFTKEGSATPSTDAAEIASVINDITVDGTNKIRLDTGSSGGIFRKWPTANSSSSDQFDGKVDHLTITARIASDVVSPLDGQEVISDVTTIHELDSGIDSLSIILSNENHTFPALGAVTLVNSSSRNVGWITDPDGSGTNITVYHGDEALELIDTTVVNEHNGLGRGQWRLGSITLSVDGDMETVDKVGDSTAKIDDFVQDADNYSWQSATVEYKILGKFSNGMNFTETVVQTFSKSAGGVPARSLMLGGQQSITKLKDTTFSPIEADFKWTAHTSNLFINEEPSFDNTVAENKINWSLEKTAGREQWENIGELTALDGTEDENNIIYAIYAHHRGWVVSAAGFLAFAGTWNSTASAYEGGDTGFTYWHNSVAAQGSLALQTTMLEAFDLLFITGNEQSTYPRFLGHNVGSYFEAYGSTSLKFKDGKLASLVGEGNMADFTLIAKTKDPDSGDTISDSFTVNILEDGVDAKTLMIEASSYNFKRSRGAGAANANVTPEKITLTAKSLNLGSRLSTDDPAKDLKTHVLWTANPSANLTGCTTAEDGDYATLEIPKSLAGQTIFTATTEDPYYAAGLGNAQYPTDSTTINILEEGEHAKTVRIEASNQIITKKQDATLDPDGTTLTAHAPNLTITSSKIGGNPTDPEVIYWQIYEGGQLLADDHLTEGAGEDYTTNGNTLTILKWDKLGDVVKFTATAYDDKHDSGLDGANLEAYPTDSMTINVLSEGADTVTIVNSNETHTITADETGGSPDMAGSGTTIKVFQGATELEYLHSFGNDDKGKWKVTAESAGGINPSNDPTAGNNNGDKEITYSDHSSFTSNAAAIEYTVTIRQKNGEEVVLTTQQTFSKAKQAVSPITVELTNPQHAFTADEVGAVGSNSFVGSGTTIRVYQGTALLGFDGAPSNGEWFFESANNGVDISPATFGQDTNYPRKLDGHWEQDGAAAVAQDLPATWPEDSATVTYNIEGKTLQGENFTASATQTFSKSKQAISPITVTLSNEDHTFAADENGAVSSFADSGCIFTVKQGTTELNCDQVGSDDGTWNIIQQEKSDTLTGTIPQPLAEAGSHKAAVAVFDTAVFATDEEFITYKIEGKTRQGTSFTESVTRTFRKQKQGITGDTGLTGAGTNFVFARAAAKPNVPTAADLNIPSADIQWYDDPPSGTDLLWSSKGTVAAGGTAYAWGAVFQVEGTAVSEIRIYSTVQASNGASPAKPTASAFNIKTSSLTIGTTPNASWDHSPPGVTADGDTVYSCTALVSGSPSDTNVAVSWSEPTIFARKTDGHSNLTVALYQRVDESLVDDYEAYVNLHQLGSFYDSGDIWNYQDGDGLVPVNIKSKAHFGRSHWHHFGFGGAAVPNPATSPEDSALLESSKQRHLPPTPPNSSMPYAQPEILPYPGDLTFDLRTGGITSGDLNGWSLELPADTSDQFPMWAIHARLSSSSSTAVAATSLWGPPIKVAEQTPKKGREYDDGGGLLFFGAWEAGDYHHYHDGVGGQGRRDIVSHLDTESTTHYYLSTSIDMVEQVIDGVSRPDLPKNREATAENAPNTDVGGTSNAYWEAFGTELRSVSTALEVVGESKVTAKLTMMEKAGETASDPPGSAGVSDMDGGSELLFRRTVDYNQASQLDRAYMHNFGFIDAYGGAPSIVELDVGGFGKDGQGGWYFDGDGKVYIGFAGGGGDAGAVDVDYFKYDGDFPYGVDGNGNGISLRVSTLSAPNFGINDLKDVITEGGTPDHAPDADDLLVWSTDAGHGSGGGHWMPKKPSAIQGIGGGASIAVQSTPPVTNLQSDPPVNVEEGYLWWDTDYAALYIAISIGGVINWVRATPEISSPV